MALIADGKRYSLVLADYRLGAGMNGLALLDAIIAGHDGARPAMALVTANFEAELISAARDRGIPLMHKPIPQAQLLQLLGMSSPSQSDEATSTQHSGAA